MASVKDFYKRKLLAAKDIANGKSIVGKITAVTPETNPKKPDELPKLVIELDDGAIRVQLNKTNALSLSAQLGDDFDQWIGKKVKVGTINTTFNNTPCKGLNVTKA